MNDNDKIMRGEELVALAAATAIEVSKCLSIEEIITLSEFLGLFKHHIEIIKQRRFLQKIEKKIEKTEKKD